MTDRNPYDDYDPEHDDSEFGDRNRDRIMFADPGGRSALRAASKSNPRNLPCPNCKRPNKLTPADRARGYQCDGCADAMERGGWGYGEY
jgi:hypothetical protein